MINHFSSVDFYIYISFNLSFPDVWWCGRGWLIKMLLIGQDNYSSGEENKDLLTLPRLLGHLPKKATAMEWNFENTF